MSSHRSHRSKPSNTYGLTKDQLNEIEEAFAIFDIDQSGTIDEGELRNALRPMGFDLSNKEIKEIMAKKDTKKTGTLKHDDFVEVCAELVKSRDPLREIKRVFLLFDDDHDGYISLKNLKRVAKELGESMTEEELQNMINRFDTDKDGKISESEFIAIMDPTGVLRK